MDSLMTNKRLTIQQCQAIVESRRNSGLSVEEWCKQNNITKSKYFNITRRLKKYSDAVNCNNEEATATFAKVVSSASSGSISITTPNATIEISDGISLSMMEAVFKALKITC